MTTEVLNVARISTLLDNSTNRINTTFIYKELNKKYGEYWQCFCAHISAVEKGINWTIKKSQNGYIDFEMAGYRLCIFKTCKHPDSSKYSDSDSD